jgi:hypothetical protein
MDYERDPNLQDLFQMDKLIAEPLEEYVASMTNSSQLFRFWTEYMRAVQVMLSLIRAERSGKWNLYIDSLVQCLPLLFAYDRQNYSTWLPIYIADMLALESTAPEVRIE